MHKSMKIEITDEVHLKAVCDVLESMGYTTERYKSECNTVCAYDDGTYICYMMRCELKYQDVDITTLTDLIALRDKQFMEQLNAAD